MSWRDNLVEAVFGGVPFKMMSHEYLSGRKAAVHEYPFQDTPFVEDLGKRGSKFIVQAYIVQSAANDWDYFGQRNGLMAILDSGKAQTFDHPYLFANGNVPKSVFALEYSMRETFQEGGIARFDITFSETSPIEQQIIYDDFSGVELVDRLAVESESTFSDTLSSISGAVTNVRSSLSKTLKLGDLNSQMAMLKSTISTIKNLPGGIVSDLLLTITQITSGLGALISSPCDLANSLINAYGVFTTGALVALNSARRDVEGACSGFVQEKGGDSSVDGVNRVSVETQDVSTGISLANAAAEMSKFGLAEDDGEVSIYGGTLPEVTITSTQSAAEAANQSIVIYAAMVNGVIQAGKIAVRVPYENREDALKIKNTIIDSIDRVLSKLAEDAAKSEFAEYGITFENDTLYKKLTEFKTVFLNAMEEIEAGLAFIQLYTVPPDVESALELSYEKYGDLNRSEEIIRRNSVVHPGFLPSGDVVELLNE